MIKDDIKIGKLVVIKTPYDRWKDGSNEDLEMYFSNTKNSRNWDKILDIVLEPCIVVKIEKNTKTNHHVDYVLLMNKNYKFLYFPKNLLKIFK